MELVEIHWNIYVEYLLSFNTFIHLNVFKPKKGHCLKQQSVWSEYTLPIHSVSSCRLMVFENI